MAAIAEIYAYYVTDDVAGADCHPGTAPAGSCHPAPPPRAASPSSAGRCAPYTISAGRPIERGDDFATIQEVGLG